MKYKSMHGRTERCINKRKNMDEWMDEWMDGKMNR